MLPWPRTDVQMWEDSVLKGGVTYQSILSTMHEVSRQENPLHRAPRNRLLELTQHQTAADAGVLLDRSCIGVILICALLGEAYIAKRRSSCNVLEVRPSSLSAPNA